MNPIVNNTNDTVTDNLGNILTSFSLIEYSKETNSTLKTDDTQLTDLFTSNEYDIVLEDNSSYVERTLLNKYSTFLFKNQNTAQRSFTINWNGKSSLAPSSYPVYLQLYNRTTGSWEEVDSENTVENNIDFSLSVVINNNLENYFDEDNWIACRVYQGRE